MARSERSCLRISPNLRPSAVSLRASVRLLTPSVCATASSRALPCGKSGVIAFSIEIRSEPALERRYASACSQWWSRISLRYGIRADETKLLCLLVEDDLVCVRTELYPASKV